jgi:hypothetical protein
MAHHKTAKRLLAERDLSSISRPKSAPAEGLPGPKPAHAQGGFPKSATAGHEFEGVARFLR